LNIYDYSVPMTDGTEQSLADYKGKVMLIVNTATGCGFTPHYEPLYTYLKSQKGFEGFGKGPKALGMSALLKKMDKDYKKNPNIKWNFTKFLVDRDGNVVARFEPTADMKAVEEAVAELI